MSSWRLMVAIACGAVALSYPLVGGALAHDGEHELAFGKPGDPGKPARTVEVLMQENDGDYEMMFIPNRLSVRVGEQIRFVLRNIGNRDHEFVLGTVVDNLAHMKEMEKHPGMVHVEPNARRLKPKETTEIFWQFTKRGTFDFSCLIPGHREAGMFGTIVVQ
jgi:uncharacterized cupredoxin-like copper-binding protein